MRTTARDRLFSDLSEIAGTLWDHAIGLKGNATCMRREQPMPARAYPRRQWFEPGAVNGPVVGLSGPNVNRSQRKFWQCG